MIDLLVSFFGMILFVVVALLIFLPWAFLIDPNWMVNEQIERELQKALRDAERLVREQEAELGTGTDQY